MTFSKRDLKYYLTKFKWSFFIMTFLYILIAILSISNSYDISVIEYLFGSILVDVGMIRNYEDFFIPFVYLFLHLIPVASLLIIFVNDHYNNGIYNILKFPSKLKYFESKFLVLTFINILIILEFIIIISITSFASGGLEIENLYMLLRISLSYMVENILLTLLASLLSLYLSTRLSILLVLSNFSLAMLTNLPYIIGQASLTYKQDIFGGEFTLKNNIIFILIYFILYILAEKVLLRKYDFYGDEK